MHLDEILCRHAAGEVTPEERRLVEEHLASCPDCRRRMDELVEVDVMLSQAAVPSLSTTHVREFLEKRLATTELLQKLFVLFGIFETLAGGLLLTLFVIGQTKPTWLVIVSAIAIADGIVLACLWFVLQERRSRLQDATTDWSYAVRELRHQLDEEYRGLKVTAAMAWVLLGCGVVNLPFIYFGRLPWLHVGLATMFVALFGFLFRFCPRRRLWITAQLAHLDAAKAESKP